MTSRPPAGPAGGALAGQFPDPSMGHPLMYGHAFFDDFRWNTVTQPWVQTTITSAPTWTPQVVAGATGVRQIATSAASANSGGVLRMGVSAQDLSEPPGIGTTFSSRCRLVGTRTDTVFWTGFNSAITTTPVTANNVQFIGFRAVNDAVEGVVKNGSGGGSETVRAAGVGLSVWRTLGWTVVEVAGAPAVQFWSADISDRRGVVVTNIGAPVTTNFPTGDFHMNALGLTTTTTAQRIAQIDFVNHGGRVARSG